MRTLYKIGGVFVLFFVACFSYAIEYQGALEVVEIDDTYVDLEWSADAEASSYIVYYDYADTVDPDDPQYFEQSDPISDTSTRIENLESDTYYSFVVTSVDGEGNESVVTSNQVTAKTFRKRPVFELSEDEIQVPESKVVIVPFTRVVDVDAGLSIRIVHVASEADVHVKGYLPGSDDLRKLQVFLSDELRVLEEYRVEVVSALDAQGNQVALESLRSRTFLADFQAEVIGEIGDTSTTPNPTPEVSNEPPVEEAPVTIDEPVKIDRLPNTGSGQWIVLISLTLLIAAGYVFLRARRT